MDAAKKGAAPRDNAAKKRGGPRKKEAKKEDAPELDLPKDFEEWCNLGNCEEQWEILQQSLPGTNQIMITVSGLASKLCS